MGRVRFSTGYVINVHEIVMPASSYLEKRQTVSYDPQNLAPHRTHRQRREAPLQRQFPASVVQVVLGRLRSCDGAAGTCPCVCRRVYVPTAPVPVRYMRVRYMVRYNSSVHCTIQRIAMHVRIPSIVRAELRANTFGQVEGPG